mmetsp:Transcript_20362/g.57349  ORF Transcript_20362/g.57349 Transcript_20362/m.57349 type:complete len:396 (-) Transcript_20362:315-1502(-)
MASVPTRATDAVNVRDDIHYPVLVGRLARQVIVHDDRAVGNVQSASTHVGCNANLNLVCGKHLIHLLSFTSLQPTGQYRNLVAVVHHLLPDGVYDPLRVAKHKALPNIDVAVDVPQCFELFGFILNEENKVLDIFRHPIPPIAVTVLVLGCLWHDLHQTPRLRHKVLLGEGPHPVVVRGRGEDDLLYVPAQLVEPFRLVTKSVPVQHLVRLVQDKQRNVVRANFKLGSSRPEAVEELSRGPDNYLRGHITHGCVLDHQGRRDVRKRRVRRNSLLDTSRQLLGRGDDYGLWNFLSRFDPLEHCQGEGDGFPCSRRGLRDNVLARKANWECLRLDGGRLIEVGRVHCFQEFRFHLEVFKRFHLGHPGRVTVTVFNIHVCVFMHGLIEPPSLTRDACG